MRLVATRVMEGYLLNSGMVLGISYYHSRVRFRTTESKGIEFHPKDKVQVLGVPAQWVAIGDRSIHGPVVVSSNREHHPFLVFTMDDGTTQTYSIGETFYLWRY